MSARWSRLEVKRTSPRHADYYRRTIEAAAKPLAITTSMAFVSDMAATEKEVFATAQDSSAGLIIGPDAFTFSHRYQIIELVNKAKLPAVYPLMPYATAGGLLLFYRRDARR